MASTDENIEWSEEKANDIWHMAGGLNSFTTPVDRRMHYCFAKVKVGGGKSRNLDVWCKSDDDRDDNRPMVVVPPEILRAWESMSPPVDYRTEHGMFRSRVDGGKGGNPNARWCLFPTGDAQIKIWAENIAAAVRHLEGGA